jgi:hypothetical protein
MFLFDIKQGMIIALKFTMRSAMIVIVQNGKGVVSNPADDAFFLFREP